MTQNKTDKFLSRTLLKLVFFSLCILVFNFSAVRRVGAAEQASGVYLLGFQSTPLAAYLPPPGFYFRNDVYYYTAHTDAAVFQGKVNLGVDGIVLADALTFSYVSKFKLLGANYGAALTVPFVLVDLGATIQGPGPGVGVSQTRAGLSDLGLVPIILGWHHKNFNFTFQTFVVLPTGSYNVNHIVNVGKNHFAFDPEFGFTWFSPENGNEVSLVLGTTFNLTNTATDYRTGDEFHSEFSFNHHFLHSSFANGGFALGAGGYFYQQFTGDSGSGAILGPFKGRVAALGPLFSYNTKLKGRDFSFNARYFREFAGKNHMEGNTFFFTIGYKLF